MELRHIHYVIKSSNEKVHLTRQCQFFNGTKF